MYDKMMMIVWGKQGINSVKNVLGHNFSSRSYFPTIYEPIKLNKNLNQLKMCWRLV